MNMRRIPSPPPFAGDVAALADFVLANIFPSPKTVEAFHKELRAYCDSNDSLFVLRAPSRARAQRGSIVTTVDGCRVRWSDNAPAWQVHHTLFYERLTDIAPFEQFIERLPTHFFQVTKRLPDSINSAGWYVAHVLPVGDRSPFSTWCRQDVVRRFVRNIHPCNLFFVPNVHGKLLGENAEVVAHFASRLRTHYASTWDDFTRMAGGGTIPTPVASALFLPGPWGHAPSLSKAKPVARSGPQHQVPPSTRARSTNTGETPCVRYSYSRLCFKRDIIEPLGDDQCFEVVTPYGTYRMKKRDFARDFPRVALTSSYRNRGIYHFKKAPRRAAQYLVTG